MKHIVALSGGKDSTALALRLKEIEPRDYIYFCTPTGEELPEMHEHWSRLEYKIGQPIIRVKSTLEGCSDLESCVKTMRCLPNWRMRWCTRILKIESAQEFYSENEPCTVYVGLRADEPEREGGLFGAGVQQRYPLREWGWNIKEVWDYLREKEITIPLRTDCGMCFYQRIGEWWNLWKYHPDYWHRYEQWESEIGKTILSPGKFSNWPSALKDLRREFERGRVPRGANVQMSALNFEQSGVCRACSI